MVVVGVSPFEISVSTTWGHGLVGELCSVRVGEGMRVGLVGTDIFQETSSLHTIFLLATFIMIIMGGLALRVHLEIAGWNNPLRLLIL